MIETRESLVGEISGRQSLSGSLNCGVVYVEPIVQEKNAIPLMEVQEITPDNGYTGLSKVTVEAVTNTIDSNIKAENIKSGVEILGVTGNYANLEQTTATEGDIAQGKTAYVSSGLVTGTGKLASSEWFRIDAYDENGYATEGTFFGDTLPQNYFYNVFSSVGLFKNITVNFTDKINFIKTSCFSGCSGLMHITNYNSITRIGPWAFQNCSKLSLTSLPTNLTLLDTGAFYSCDKITISSIPPGVRTITSQAFHYCKAIPKINFLGDIYYIYNHAFYGCTKLTKLSFPNNTAIPELININAFQNCPLETIEVPSSLVDDWKSATNWSNYADIIVGI